VLITAGASAPEEVVQECVEYFAGALRRDGREAGPVREGARQFSRLPRELRVLVN